MCVLCQRNTSSNPAGDANFFSRFSHRAFRVASGRSPNHTHTSLPGARAKYSRPTCFGGTSGRQQFSGRSPARLPGYAGKSSSHLLCQLWKHLSMGWPRCSSTPSPCHRRVRKANTHRSLGLHSHRRTCHVSTATASHEAAARTRAQAGDCTIIDQTMRPKAASPKLPSAAPAASSAAASLPRRAPGRPASSLRSRTCFSINVALAGKIAGKARNRPPTTGPKRAAMRPATTVIAPPSTNLTRYSYQRV